MDCFRITPWGVVTPGLNSIISDSDELGQTLHVIMTANNESTFKVGPDLMPFCWTDRKKWGVGFSILRFILGQSGHLILIDYRSDSFGLLQDKKVKGSNAVVLEVIQDPETNAVIGSLWEMEVDSQIIGVGWSFQAQPGRRLVIKPKGGRCAS